MMDPATAKAVEQSAKASGQAIELARDAGRYFDRVFGDLPVNVVGMLGADWLREVRIRN